jgi:aspartyl-tRNA synthetase
MYLLVIYNLCVNLLKLDLEMAFADEKSVMNAIEYVVRGLWRNLLSQELPSKFPQLPYQEAMSVYGSDKPDTRYGMKVC